MKVALVLAPMSLEERYGKAISTVAGTLPPLGLLNLGAVLKDEHEVLILDGSKRDFVTILSKLKDLRPDVIGIGVMTFIWPKVKGMLASLRQEFPTSFLVIGGPHASIYRKSCLEESPDLDALVFGEGELTVQEMVENLEIKKPFHGVKGIIFRDGTEIVENSPRELIADLDQLPFPARELIDVLDYTPAFSQYKRKPVTNIFTSRGCPFKCIFCTPEIIGRKMRYRSPENIVEEMEHLKLSYGIKDIAIWDDTFTLDMRRTARFCELLIERKLGVIWSAQTRTDRVDGDLLKKMAESGCWKLHFGLESLVQKNLDALRKGTTVEQNYKAVKWSKEAGIEVEASFIFGIPGETFEEGLSTIDQSTKMDLDYVRFFYFTPYGELLNEIDKYGRLIVQDMSRFQYHEPVFVPFSMTEEELKRLVSRAYRKFYLRPKYVWKRLKKFNDYRQVIMTLKGTIALGSLLLKLGAAKSGLRKKMSGDAV